TYATWAQRVTLSALYGSGIQELLDAVQQAWRSARMEFSTSELTRVLLKAVEAHQPPMSQGRAAKLRFAHSGGRMPPRIIIHGSRTETLPDSYTRYLSNSLISHFRLKGTPIVLEFRNSANPYKDKKNVLSKRQVQKRQRLKKFSSGKDRKPSRKH
ncbi:MAG TPA: ribosome biogenesis GTPase Der, partial [Xanthomonadales bacterium]|nr:ribosome biogenesis GTPase Der [Xanthomonadales bacterium]